MGISKSFWQNRRVLVTGHTGFKGAWLSLWLQSLGADVCGFSLPPPTTPSLFEVARIGENITHLTGDLREATQVELALRASAPEIVFHLGAQALVRESYLEPVATFATNVMGTAHLLDSVRSSPSVKAVLVVTSDKCYENHETGTPYRENDPMGGKDPYSASKGCTELVTAAWRHSFLGATTAIATARAGNVIGGGDWAADRLVPDALRAWSDSKTLSIRNPKATRPWQYHLDALAGYLMLAAELLEGKHAGAWNFGPPDTDALPVEALLQQLANVWGEGARWETSTDHQPHEAMQLQLDSSKARSKLGWSSRTSIAQSAAAIVAWHQAWLRGENMRDFSLTQINQYCSELA